MTGSRRPSVRVLGGLLGAAVAATLTATATPSASADSMIRPSGGTFTVRGAGFGHGWGMSQYGAHGAASLGLTWREIVAFYYPGTTIGNLADDDTIRVRISADYDNDLRVGPAPGQRITSGSETYTLPVAARYTQWRISRSGSGYRLSYRDADGDWHAKSSGLGTGTWTVRNSARTVSVILPSGARREYRGRMSLVKSGTGGRTVNTVTMENYLRSVVPSEMPTSWHPEAVRSQAVAARTYAAKLRSWSTSSGWDICDTTACQVYSGYAVTSGGKRIVRESARGDAAIEATAGKIVRYRGAIALTQFASSNGGHSAQGDYAYLAPHADPYDSVIVSQAWTRTVSAASLRRIWPSVGTVRGITVTRRDGDGKWGGRVVELRLVGTSRTITMSGGRFKSAFGLRSTLFTLGSSASAAPAPATPVAPGRKYASFPHTYGAPGTKEVLIVNAAGDLRRYRTTGTGLASGATLAGGFGGYSQVVNAGDWNGDGYQDVITKTAKDRLLLFCGTGRGLKAGVDIAVDAPYRSITAVGDVTGDGFPDLAAISRGDNFYLIPGNGKTGRKPAVRLAAGWDGRDWLRGVGDLSGDGKPDLVTKVGDRLYLHRGTSGGFASPVSLGTGWGRYSAVTGVGDITGDRRADLVVRTSSGRLLVAAGTSKGGLGTPKALGSGFQGTRFAT